MKLIQNFLRSKYLLLLIALISAIFFLPFIDDLVYGRMIFSAIFLFIIMGVSYGVRGFTSHVWILILLGFLGLFINFFALKMTGLAILSNTIISIFYIYVIAILCKDVFINKNVTLEILMGSICIYLLIAIMYATFYAILQKIDPSTFLLKENYHPVHTAFDFYYFSFVTIATVGFGDIVPHTHLAKSIVMLESITGIFYVAILVSRLVALLER